MEARFHRLKRRMPVSPLCVPAIGIAMLLMLPRLLRASGPHTIAGTSYSIPRSRALH